MTATLSPAEMAALLRFAGKLLWPQAYQRLARGKMTKASNQSRDPQARVILIVLNHAEFLFARGVPDPLAGSFEHPSGMDQIIAHVHARGRRQAVDDIIRVRLTDQPATPELERQIANAIKGYSLNKAEIGRARLKSINKAGLDALWLGLAFLAACLSVSSAVTAMEGLPAFVRRLFGEGLSIAGWVGLWRPIELLLYDTWPIRHEIRTLDTIAKMRVELDSGSESASPETP